MNAEPNGGTGSLGVKLGNKELVARGGLTVGVLLIILSVGAQVWVTDLMRKDLLGAVHELAENQARYAAQLQENDESLVRITQINSCLNTLGSDTTRAIREKMHDRQPREAFDFVLSYCPWLAHYRR